MDFHPLPGQCRGAPLDLAAAAGDIGFALDFDGATRKDATLRGAYAGESGWPLAAAIKGE
jgi:hypothetical protein